MKILVLLTDLFDTLGGIQSFNRCLVKALVDIAEQRQWGGIVLALNDRGSSNLVATYLKDTRWEYRAFGSARFRFVLASLRASLTADVVLCGHVHLSPLAWGMKVLRRGTQICLVVHGIEVWKRLTAFQRKAVK